MRKAPENDLNYHPSDNCDNKTNSTGDTFHEKNKLEFIKHNYFGTGGYEICHPFSYLLKHRRESANDFNYRRKASTFTNFFRPLIDIYLKPIWASKKDLITSNERIKGLYEDTKLVKNSNKAVRELKLYGQVYYGVEFDGEELPEINIVQTPSIKNIETKSNRIHKLEWEEFKIYKGVQIPVACEYSDQSAIKITMAWIDADGKIVLKEPNGGTRLTVFDQMIEEAIYHHTGELEIDEVTENYQMALVNKEIFNLKSYSKEIIGEQAFSLLVIATDAKIKDLKVGTSRAIKVPSTVTKMPEYVEISDVNYDIISREIENYQQYLYKMFTSNLLADNIKYTTAMSTLLASRSFDGELQYLFNNYQIIMNTLLNNMVDYFSIVSPYKIEFGVITYDINQVRKEAAGSLGVEGELETDFED